MPFTYFFQFTLCDIIFIAIRIEVSLKKFLGYKNIRDKQTIWKTSLLCPLASKIFFLKWMTSNIAPRSKTKNIFLFHIININTNNNNNHNHYNCCHETIQQIIPLHIPHPLTFKHSHTRFPLTPITTQSR